MNANFVNIDYILEQLNSERIPGTYWNISEIKEWIYKALTKLNITKSKVYDNVIIEIIDGKGLIPSYVETISSIFTPEGTELHLPIGGTYLSDSTYIINNGFLYVNFDKGSLIMFYYKFPVDTNGDPLIPDTSYIISAVLAYLKYKLGERAYFSSKILEHQFRYLEQKWLFNLPSAQATSKSGIYKDSKRFKSIHNKHLL